MMIFLNKWMSNIVSCYVGLKELQCLSHYFRVFLKGKAVVNHELKTWKCTVHHKQEDSEQKRLLSRQFAINLKNIRPTFSKINQMQSISRLSICVHMLLFPIAVFLLCYSTDLSGYCNVSFYFLGILGVLKLHNFAWHSPFKMKLKKLRFKTPMSWIVTFKVAFLLSWSSMKLCLIFNLAALWTVMWTVICLMKISYASAVNRVCAGHENPGKSWNLRFIFQAWKLKSLNLIITKW